MNTIKLAPHDLCTGCGACAAKCPRQCISIEENASGIILPVINAHTCIKCHACERVCPLLNMPELHKPTSAYAAWSNDEEERRTSASGGIAIEMYKYALQFGWYAIGASLNADFSVTHKMVCDAEALCQFKNSKYVFSNAHHIIPKIGERLKNGDKVIFIGLPCQTAALRKLYKDNDNLLLVELVCHGTTPHSYLRRHIDSISGQMDKEAKGVFFRDPTYDTHTFTFSIYDKEGIRFYAKPVKDDDTYQFGYHSAISYRENCYHCHFARPERNADIIIADYHGLGRLAPCVFGPKGVSLILENTDKGKQFVRELIRSNRIHAELRPLEEPFMGEPQLRHPSKKTKYRLLFEKEMISNNGDFEKAIIRPFRKYRRDKKIKDAIMSVRKVLHGIKKAVGI